VQKKSFTIREFAATGGKARAKKLTKEQLSAIGRKGGRPITIMSKHQIAKKLGISHQAVYGWYNGRTIPRQENLIHLSQILAVSVETVLDSFRRNKI
jgi:transcriptional regulator with XRE-family HTH domain